MSNSKRKNGTNQRDRIGAALFACALLAATACSSPEPTAPPAASPTAPPAAQEVAPAAAPTAAPPSIPPVPSDVPAKVEGANLTMESAAVDGLEATAIQCRTNGQMFAGMAILGSLAQRKAALDACATKGEVVRVHFAADGAKTGDVRVSGASDPVIARCVADVLAATTFPSVCACALSIRIGPA